MKLGIKEKKIFILPSLSFIKGASEREFVVLKPDTGFLTTLISPLIAEGFFFCDQFTIITI